MIVIASVDHGECEKILCETLSQWLRIGIFNVAREGGSETISLREAGDFLKEGVFKDLNAFQRHYKSEQKGRFGRSISMDEITVFVIMDVDGDRRSMKSFRSKDAFRGSAFYDRIIPVLNNPSMDAVFRDAGVDIPEGGKPEAYRRALNEIGDPEELCRLLEGKNTDNPMMIREIEKHCPDFQRLLQQ